jgi:hypothetical protein
MTRRISFLRWPLAVAVVASALALPRPASAQELVTITEVSFDRFGSILGISPVIAVSITCDATGMIGDLEIFVEQRGLFANTNLNLLDAPCTTVPTRYRIQLDYFGDEPFQPGKLVVVSATALPSGDEFGAGQKIIILKEPLP